MAEEWTPIAPEPKAETWTPIAAEAPPDLSNPAMQQTVARSRVGRILDAFHMGAERGYGDAPAGFSPESKTWFSKHTEWANDSVRGFVSGLMVSAAEQLDFTMRGISSMGYAVGDAAVEAGAVADEALGTKHQFSSLARDLAAMPASRFGTPNQPMAIRSMSKPTITSPLAVAYDLGVLEKLEPPKAAVDRASAVNPLPEHAVSPESVAEQIKPLASPVAEIARQGMEQIKSRLTEIQTDLNKMEPPKAPDTIRLYHGMDDAETLQGGGGRFATPHYDYAANYRGAKEVAYVDVPTQVLKTDPAFRDFYDDVNGRVRHAELTEEWAKKLTPMEKIDTAKKQALADEARQLIDTHEKLADTAVMPKQEVALAAKREVAPTDLIDKAGNIRLDRINTTEDMKEVMRQTSDQAGGFMEARRGEIAPAHREVVANILGMKAADIDFDGLARNADGDAKLRVLLKTFQQSASDMVERINRAAASGSDADRIAVQEGRIRHSLIQEYVSGLTAEWGRSGRVLQEFLENTKDARGLSDFLNKYGQTSENLDKLIEAGKGLKPDRMAKLLTDSRQPNFWDKVLNYRINNFLSGPFTHIKYDMAMAAFSIYDDLLVRPAAGIIGHIRNALSKEDITRTYIGEGPSHLFGMMLGVPDGIRAAFEALRTGDATLLPRQITQGEKPFSRVRPIQGRLGDAINLPSRVVTANYTMFDHIFYRAELEAQAYRQAAKDGLNPITHNQAFWQRQHQHTQFPSPEMMDAAVAASKENVFTTDLGSFGKGIQRFLYDTQAGRAMQFIVPFFHVSANVFKKIGQNTPMSFIGPEVRAEMLGEKAQPRINEITRLLNVETNQAKIDALTKEQQQLIKNQPIARDVQVARWGVASALTGYVASKVLADEVTGDGPPDPTENKQWRLTHKPRSLRVGDEWVSLDRFGPLGGVAVLAANLTDAGHATAKADYEEAAARIVASVHTLLGEAPGMQSIQDMVELMNSKTEDKMTKAASNIAGSFIPFSIGLGQTASLLDPQMRDTKAFTDALVAKVPGWRNSLYPVRDWTGQPVANDRSGWGAFIATRAVNQDPIDMELSRLNINPTLPRKEIGGVELDRKEWEEYQTLAGPLTRTNLEMLVRMPGWYDMPTHVQTERFNHTISKSRQQARMMMQIKDGGALLNQGNQLKLDTITAP